MLSLGSEYFKTITSDSAVEYLSGVGRAHGWSRV